MTKSQIAFQEKAFHKEYLDLVNRTRSYTQPVLSDSEMVPEAVIQDAKYYKGISMGAGSRYAYYDSTEVNVPKIRTGKRCRVILVSLGATQGAAVEVGDGSFLNLDRGAFSSESFSLKCGPLSCVKISAFSVWHIFSSYKVQISGGTCGIYLDMYSPCSIFAVSGDVTVTLDSKSVTVPEGLCISWNRRSTFNQAEIDKIAKKVRNNQRGYIFRD